MIPQGREFTRSLVRTVVKITLEKLESRIKSHKASKKSAIKGHTHPLDGFDWSFIARAHDTNDRKIMESFLIKERRPVLNRNLGVDSYVFV